MILNHGDFSIKDGLLYVQQFGIDKEIPLEYKRGGATKPYSLSALGQKYDTAFVQETLGFQDYAHNPLGLCLIPVPLGFFG